MAQALIKITGRVQGVCFRAETRKTATTLGLFGYTKNLPDGSVEVLAQGQQAAIEALIAFCENGPDAAHVKSCEVEWAEGGKIYSDFISC